MSNATLSVEPYPLSAYINPVDYFDDRNQQFVERFIHPSEPRGVLVTSDHYKRPYYFPNLSAAAYVRDLPSFSEERRDAATAACDYYRFH